MNRYFYCYSYPLKEFIKVHGIRFITAAVNMNTHKKYWVFEDTEELNRLLEAWRTREH